MRFLILIRPKGVPWNVDAEFSARPLRQWLTDHSARIEGIDFFGGATGALAVIQAASAPALGEILAAYPYRSAVEIEVRGLTDDLATIAAISEAKRWRARCAEEIRGAAHDQRVAAAESCYFPLLERIETVDPRHPLVGEILTSLRERYRDEGRLEEARKISEKLLAFHEAVAGTDHVGLAFDLETLGVLQEPSDASEQSYLRALRLIEGALGAGHPDTARALRLLAQHYQSVGRAAEARQALQKVRQLLPSSMA